MAQPETRLQSLTLSNYRCFQEVSIDFHRDLTVLVADNGGGKTAILDAIAVAVGHLVSELRGQGRQASAEATSASPAHHPVPWLRRCQPPWTRKG